MIHVDQVLELADRLMEDRGIIISKEVKAIAQAIVIRTNVELDARFSHNQTIKNLSLENETIIKRVIDKLDCLSAFPEKITTTHIRNLILELHLTLN